MMSTPHGVVRLLCSNLTSLTKSLGIVALVSHVRSRRKNNTCSEHIEIQYILGGGLKHLFLPYLGT